MSLISLRQLLDHAAENNYGVPAFNVNNLEAIRAIMEGAKELNSPVILQASGAARKYAGPIFVKKLVEAAMDEFSEIPTVLHQDHGGSPKDCKNCIELGFTSVMMDGSLLDDQKTPSDFEYNVRVTKETTDMAHALGVSVEGEIGCLGSLETGTGEKEDGVGAEGKLDHDQLLTDPDEASDFVKATNVDALAIAIGTSHGAYKFSRPPTGDILAIDRIKEKLNPQLSVRGILLTMFDKRNKLSGEVDIEARNHFKSKVYNTVIPRNVRLSEAPSHGLPCVIYDKACVGSKAYFDLANEFLSSNKEASAA